MLHGWMWKLQHFVVDSMRRPNEINHLRHHSPNTSGLESCNWSVCKCSWLHSAGPSTEPMEERAQPVKLALEIRSQKNLSKPGSFQSLRMYMDINQGVLKRHIKWKIAKTQKTFIFLEHTRIRKPSQILSYVERLSLTRQNKLMIKTDAYNCIWKMKPTWIFDHLLLAV